MIRCNPHNRFSSVVVVSSLHYLEYCTLCAICKEILFKSARNPLPRNGLQFGNIFCTASPDGFADLPARLRPHGFADLPARLRPHGSPTCPHGFARTASPARIADLPARIADLPARIADLPDGFADLPARLRPHGSPARIADLPARLRPHGSPTCPHGFARTDRRPTRTATPQLGWPSTPPQG
jgi:hypothetical protein